nr:DUF389 domain-containing protein [Mangrovicoccus ximenensis]
MLLALAVIIATMGPMRASGVVNIAAMLVAPLMTPILGIAAAVTMGWVGRAAWLLLVLWAAAACAVGVAWLIVFLSDVPRGILLTHEVLSRTDPGGEDLVIALAAGVAGPMPRSTAPRPACCPAPPSACRWCRRFRPRASGSISARRWRRCCASRRCCANPGGFIP